MSRNAFSDLIDAAADLLKKTPAALAEMKGNMGTTLASESALPKIWVAWAIDRDGKVPPSLLRVTDSPPSADVTDLVYREASEAEPGKMVKWAAYVAAPE